MTVMQDALNLLISKGKFSSPSDGVFRIHIFSFLHKKEIELLQSQFKFQSYEIVSIEAESGFYFTMSWTK